MSLSSLEFFLLSGLCSLVLFNVILLVWVLTLSRRLRTKPTTKTYDIHLEGKEALAELDMTEVKQHAQTVLRQSVDEAAAQMQNALAQSVNEVSGSVGSIVQTGFNQEFQKYQISLSELQAQTIEHIGKLQTEVDQRKQELLGQLEAKVAEERAKHMESFNERINDVVAAYLAETLPNQVDLGAQWPYIMQSLEQHKEDIKRDVLA